MNPNNPFYILDLEGDAVTPAEIERQGRKLLGLFEIGAAKARTYTCPLGTFPRDATMVREAMSALRDPTRRLREACLVTLLKGMKSEPDRGAGANDDYAPDAPLEDAFIVGGYRGF